MLDQAYPTFQSNIANDVFISSIQTRVGNLLVFEGVTGSNDYNIQTILSVISGPNTPNEFIPIFKSCLSLLKVSNAIVKRLGLKRLYSIESIDDSKINEFIATHLSNSKNAITFSSEDLLALKINPETLSPFILNGDKRKKLLNQSSIDSDISKFPILVDENDYIIYMPHAIGLAIVNYIISTTNELGFTIPFNTVLSQLQFNQIHNEGLNDLLRKSKYLPLPEFEIGSLACQSELFRYDNDKYIHIIFIHEDIKDCYNNGLSSYFSFSESTQNRIVEFIDVVVNQCKSFDDFKYGFTILMVGGFGRGVILDLGEIREQWSILNIRIPDLLMMASDTNNSVDKFLKFGKQVDFIKRNDARVISEFGDFGHYCYWESVKNQVLPRELVFGQPSMMEFDSGYVLPVRKRIRELNDKHMISDTEGKFWLVNRLGKNTYFKTLANLPIYISETHLNMGMWAGAVTSNIGKQFWLKILFGEQNNDYLLLIKDLFDGLLQLLHKLVYETNISELSTELPILEIMLNFSDVDFQLNSFERQNDDNEILFQKESKNKFNIGIPKYFLTVFEGDSDRGERKLFESLIFGILNLSDKKSDKGIVDKYLNRVFNKNGIKLLHMFETYYEIDVLTNQSEEPKFLSHEDFVYNKIGMNQVIDIESMNFELIGKKDCNHFLHSLVDKIWKDIKSILSTLNQKSLLEKLLRMYESLIHDRSLWNKTSKAILSLYGDEESVLDSALKRETNRTNASIAIRTITEMGLCECKLNGGNNSSDWIVDELLAKAMILIEVATDSDSIYQNFAGPKIHLEKNGEYDMDRSYNEKLLYPYRKSFHVQDFKKSVSDYGELYNVSKPNGRKYLSDLYSDDFISAFKIEYQITPDDVLDCFSELLELALKKNKVVVSTTIGEIRKEITSNRNINNESFTAFLNFFALFKRKNWDKPPSGCKPEDIAPWRFRRKVSMVSKPILVCGKGNDEDHVLYGIRSLQEGLHYVMDRSEKGFLRTENFSSYEMISYIGKIKNLRGHEFGKQVGKKLEAAGWNVRCEVQMSELGASAELGDVDVLAWNSKHEVVIIECKRLQFAKTIPEIAEVCKKFKGEAKDELRKHLNRVEFLESNPKNFKRVIGFIPEKSKTFDRLVTNTIVPMQFIKDLPIESSKIGPIKEPFVL